MTAASPALPPSPLPEDRRALLARLVDGLDGPSLWWLSGYTAGLAQGHGTPPSLALVPASAAAPATGQRLTVLYGSQTGNARREAERLASEAEAAGLSVRVVRTDAYATRELAGERLLYVVISTQGEGDPPDDAIGFVEFLAGRRAPKLPDLKFAVLGLGDSSYADFCGIGRRIDARLAELGGSRLQPLGEADLDIDTVAAPWRRQALSQAQAFLDSAPSGKVTPLRHATPATPATQPWSPTRPFTAEVLANQPLSGREFKGPAFRQYGAPSKQVHHLELSLEGSGLTYEPGDALGVVHRNPPALVEAVLDALKLDGHADVTVDADTLPLSEWLATRRELTKLSRPLLAAHAERSGADELKQLLDPTQTAGLATLLADHQLIDVLRRWPADWDQQSLLQVLRPLTPRLYSIASSRKRVGDEVHLTVDALRYHAHGHDHVGAASGFLSALAEGAHAAVYVEANERFRIPADASRDIIMIGPGTGVAPFRGFVQERAETGASGRNWLLFGAQHFNRDFLYQAEWQQALQRGELHALDLAFSRDQAEKRYVQHRLRQRGRDVWDWLHNGAHIYVCGAIGMGKDVHAALTSIAIEHGGLDADAAHEHLTTLQREGRYSRDVY